LIALYADHQDVKVYADLNGFHFNELPQETIPSTVLITPYRPDFILYNSCSSPMGIIALLTINNTLSLLIIESNKSLNIFSHLQSYTD